jgi:hypothetical protein
VGFAAFLRRILGLKALVSIAGDGSIILREKGVMEVKVANTPPDVTAINLDRLGSLSGLREGEWKRNCDYLLVYEDRNTCVAILVDLKKTIHADGKPKVQLRWSLPILEYLCALYAIHSASEFNSENTLVRYYIIATKYNPRIDKQGVKPRPGVVQRETYKDIEIHTYVGPKIAFNLLVRGGRDGGVAA